MSHLQVYHLVEYHLISIQSLMSSTHLTVLDIYTDTIHYRHIAYYYQSITLQAIYYRIYALTGYYILATTCYSLHRPKNMILLLRLLYPTQSFYSYYTLHSQVSISYLYSQSYLSILQTCLILDLSSSILQTTLSHLYPTSSTRSVHSLVSIYSYYYIVLVSSYTYYTLSYRCLHHPSVFYRIDHQTVDHTSIQTHVYTVTHLLDYFYTLDIYSYTRYHSSYSLLRYTVFSHSSFIVIYHYIVYYIYLYYRIIHIDLYSPYSPVNQSLHVLKYL